MANLNKTTVIMMYTCNTVDVLLQNKPQSIPLEPKIVVMRKTIDGKVSIIGSQID